MQPVVILGGFLSYAGYYRGLASALSAWSGQEVFVARVQPQHWLPAVTSLGWKLLLDRLDWAVGRAVKSSSTGKVTLVGHSAGGVLARLYLSPEPFWGRRYAGLRRVDRLITLGSPHHNAGGLDRGGPMSRWVERRCPGAAFKEQVKYVSVAGKAVHGNPAGTESAARAARLYRDLCGDERAWGDGVVPVPSALLHGSEPVVLDGVHHFPASGRLWYGSEEILPRWWRE